MYVLRDVNDTYKKKKAELCLRNPSADVMSKLVASRLAKAIWQDNFSVCMHDILNDCLIKLG